MKTAALTDRGATCRVSTPRPKPCLRPTASGTSSTRRYLLCRHPSIDHSKAQQCLQSRLTKTGVRDWRGRRRRSARQKTRRVLTWSSSSAQRPIPSARLRACSRGLFVCARTLPEQTPSSPRPRRRLSAGPGPSRTRGGAPRRRARVSALGSEGTQPGARHAARSLGARAAAPRRGRGTRAPARATPCRRCRVRPCSTAVTLDDRHGDAVVNGGDSDGFGLTVISAGFRAENAFATRIGGHTPCARRCRSICARRRSRAAASRTRPRDAPLARPPALPPPSRLGRPRRRRSPSNPRRARLAARPRRALALAPWRHRAPREPPPGAAPRPPPPVRSRRRPPRRPLPSPRWRARCPSGTWPPRSWRTTWARAIPNASRGARGSRRRPRRWLPPAWRT